MTARKPKPTELKEQPSHRDQMDLGRLFASANSFVKKSEALAIVPPEEDPTLKIENHRKSASQSHSEPKVEKKVTRKAAGRKVAAQKPTSTGVTPTLQSDPVRHTTSVTHVKANELPRENSKARSYVPWLLLIPAFSLFAYLAFAPESGQRFGHQSQLTESQIQERLAFHRSLTGTRLNRERIDVQIQNHLDAPEIGSDDKKIKTPDMMNGLPLIGEQNQFSQKLKSDRPVNPSHPDAQVMYGLQEEQDRAGFETQARKAWLKEFVENARKDGYSVKIDQFGNVQSKRLAPSEREPSNETGLNSSAGTETLIEY